jgi:hypothetical protein
MPLPVIESLSSNGARVVTSIDMSMPAGLSVGDFILFIMASEQSSTNEWLDTGDMSIFTSLHALNNDADAQQSLYYKIADANDANSGNWPKTVNHTNARQLAGFVLRISGVDPTTPFNQTPTFQVGSSTGGTITGVTTDADDCKIIATYNTDGTLQLPTTAAGTGWGTTPNESVVSQADNANDTGIDLYYKDLVSQGASQDIVMAHKNSVLDGWIGTQIALNPAPAGSGLIVLGIPEIVVTP